MRQASSRLCGVIGTVVAAAWWTPGLCEAKAAGIPARVIAIGYADDLAQLNGRDVAARTKIWLLSQTSVANAEVSGVGASLWSEGCSGKSLQARKMKFLRGPIIALVGGTPKRCSWPDLVKIVGDEEYLKRQIGDPKTGTWACADADGDGSPDFGLIAWSSAEHSYLELYECTDGRCKASAMCYQ